MPAKSTQASTAVPRPRVAALREALEVGVVRGVRLSLTLRRRCPAEGFGPQEGSGTDRVDKKL